MRGFLLCSNYRTFLQAREIYRTFPLVLSRFESHATNCSNGSLVSKEEIQDFQKHGVVCLRGHFKGPWLTNVKEGIRKVLENPSEFSEKLTHGTDKNMVYFNDYWNWRRVSELSNFVFNSPACEIARQLMASTKVAFYHEHIFVKDPGTCSTTPWHHDQAYYPLDGWKNCSFWMPTEHVSKNNCIKYIKGSHRWGKWFIPKKFETNKSYNINEDENHHYTEMCDFDEDKNEILTWDLEPGDCIAFHMLTIHGAPESTDEDGRQVLATRWLGDDIVLATRPWVTSPPIVPEGFKPGESVFQYPELFQVVKQQ